MKAAKRLARARAREKRESERARAREKRESERARRRERVRALQREAARIDAALTLIAMLLVFAFLYTEGRSS